MDNGGISDCADTQVQVGFGDSDPEFLRPHERPPRPASHHPKTADLWDNIAPARSRVIKQDPNVIINSVPFPE